MHLDRSALHLFLHTEAHYTQGIVVEVSLESFS